MVKIEDEDAHAALYRSLRTNLNFLLKGPTKALKAKPCGKHKEVAVLLPPPPTELKNNWIGPPHPVSNLRLVTFYKPANESQVEKYFREKQAEVQNWNQQFWEAHNSKFVKMKDEFVFAKRKELFGEEAGKNVPLPAEEMSKFYKKFLDDNRDVHLTYNREWYKRNIGLLFPALLVFLYQLGRKLRLVKS